MERRVVRPVARPMGARLVLGRTFWTTFGRSVGLLVVALGGIVILAPLGWMLSTSLKGPGQVLLLPPVWIPYPLQWRNYLEAFSFMQGPVVYRNTILITLTDVLGEVISASLVGFAFARLRTPGKEVLFILVLSSLMLPYQVVLIPQFILFKLFGWVNTFYPLIVPAFLGSPVYIFLMRQFLLTQPPEMDDAARVDGCGYFGIYWHIALPLSKPALGAVAIFTFMANWNDFLRPLIYLNSASLYTVALALQNFTADYGMTPWHLLMAASLTALLPCMVLFFVTQRFFIQGIVITGVKG